MGLVGEVYKALRITHVVEEQERMIAYFPKVVYYGECKVFIVSIQVLFSVSKKGLINIQLRLSHIAWNNVFVPLWKLTLNLKLFFCSS